MTQRSLSLLAFGIACRISTTVPLALGAAVFKTESPASAAAREQLPPRLNGDDSGHVLRCRRRPSELTALRRVSGESILVEPNAFGSGTSMLASPKRGTRSPLAVAPSVSPTQRPLPRDIDEASRVLQATQREFRARWGTRLLEALETIDQAVRSSGSIQPQSAAMPLAVVIAGPDSDSRMLDAIISEVLTMTRLAHGVGDERAQHLGFWGQDLSEAQFLSGDPDVIRSLERARVGDPSRATLYESLLARVRESRDRGMTLMKSLQWVAARAEADGQQQRALRIRIVELALRTRNTPR